MMSDPYTITNVERRHVQDWTWMLSFTLTAGPLSVQAELTCCMEPGHPLEEEQALNLIRSNADKIIAMAWSMKEGE